MYKKPIIVFEGIEGSGKSLHINNVAVYLKKKGRKYIKIREPGGNRNSEKIRKLILNNKSVILSKLDLLLNINFLIFSEFRLPPGSLILIYFLSLFLR